MKDITALLIELEPQIRLGTFVGVLLTMMVWERAAPLRALRQSLTLRWSGNLGIAAISATFTRLAAPIIPAGVAAMASANNWGLLNLIDTLGWLAFLVSLLALDALIYAQHRAFHAIPILWRLHRVHHADLELDATTGLRFHPIEIILSLVIKSGAIIILGAPVAAVIMFEVILNAAAMFNHANVAITPTIDRWLRLVVVTPLMHRVHHSVVQAETDRNFGFFLPWWDYIFATYQAAPSAGYKDMIVGLPAFRSPRESRLDSLLIQPFRVER
ncbi:MAG TPA: sterol desaturase [Rhodospirillaceae bacterium]|nr:sterol desaturase [Rhodospirillaceae bacterium]